MNITRTKVEYRYNPIGLDVTEPTFSWNVETEEKNWKQEAYQILVADDEAILANHQGNIWDSGKVMSNWMVNVVYSGKPLESTKRYFWKVRVWQNGESSDYSSTNFFEMGFLQEACWRGSWIGETECNVHHMYRRTFEAAAKVTKARAYICGLGQYLGSF